VRFEVLGPLRVIDECDDAGDDGAGLRLGGARQQLVLAMLLAQPNSVVSTDALVDGLWGDSPPSAARHTVQGYVSELRRLLGPVIERNGAGYFVRADRASLDSVEFETLLSEGRATLAENPEVAAETLRTGLRLWRGLPFAGLDDAGVLVAERTRLVELQLLALEDRFDAELASGRHREVAAELDALSRQHPYREGLRARHMLALYRSGRQAEALRAFQQTRAVLVDELGLEPSPLLRQMEEQILVQDPALDLASLNGESPSDPHQPRGNPYVGLRAFTEADADNFYGRDELIEQLASIVTGDARLTAVVGPSGSGKSSLVQAGLIPALRNPERRDVNWVIAVMRPGAYPFTELEASLGRAVADPSARSMSALWDDDSELLRAVLRVLPDDASRLLLVIDQFEELFALVDDEQRERFLGSLITLASDPRGRTRVLVTLRADFYDRPLMHPAFGRMMTGHVFNVVPLAADELEAAALGPARRVGATFEQGLLAELIAEVSGQPNALPLFQYTLTELFDRREDSTLTRPAYQALGRIRGAVASRAEEIYEQLNLEQQDAARQLFLRLVTVGRDSETRRVVAASELVTLDVDIVTMHGALEAFVANRLLVRDRDAFSGALKVEVAHEALLTEWQRLRRWIDEGRDDLRQHAAYSLVVDEWLTSGRDPDFLLTGGRLELFEQWRATTTMRLTTLEREFLDEALRQREEVEAAEAARGAEQARLRRRARRGAFALGAVAAAITTVVVVAGVAALPTGNNPQIAAFASGDPDNQPSEAYEQGFVRAERDFDLELDRRDLALEPATFLTEISALDTDLVILDPLASRWMRPDIVDPNTHYVLTDYEDSDFDHLANVSNYYWAEEQLGFLAGVAAATTTETGIVGFLGTVQTARGQEDYRAGFEAGAESVDPDITILAAYLADFGYRSEPNDAPAGARYIAGLLYDAGADVIFHVAGRSGIGVLDAASGLSTNKRWVIGVETDQWQAASARQRPHILTSIVKRFDTQTYDAIHDHLDGHLDSGAHRLTAADGMITYAQSGNALSADARANLDRTIEQLAAGEIRPPRTPDGALTERDSILETGIGTSYFAGARDVPVRFTLPAGWEVDGIVVGKSDDGWSIGVSFWEVGQIYDDPCQWVLVDPPVGPTIDDLVAALTNSAGFAATEASDVTIDGYEGQRIDLIVPDYNQDECRDGRFGLWTEAGQGTGGPNRWAQGPGQQLQLWILDVDGTRLVINASSFPNTSAQDRADLDEVLRSIQIG
jgi:basic membrane lipoprotein Med (substrate-binding protein (PBP1-ABC) superfamily)/DNA-binding SARP family transcriptional activator